MEDEGRARELIMVGALTWPPVPLLINMGAPTMAPYPQRLERPGVAGTLRSTVKDRRAGDSYGSG